MPSCPSSACGRSLRPGARWCDGCGCAVPPTSASLVSASGGGDVQPFAGLPSPAGPAAPASPRNDALLRLPSLGRGGPSVNNFLDDDDDDDVDDVNDVNGAGGGDSHDKVDGDAREARQAAVARDSGVKPRLERPPLVAAASVSTPDAPALSRRISAVRPAQAAPLRFAERLWDRWVEVFAQAGQAAETVDRIAAVLRRVAEAEAARGRAYAAVTARSGRDPWLPAVERRSLAAGWDSVMEAVEASGRTSLKRAALLEEQAVGPLEELAAHYRQRSAMLSQRCAEAEREFARCEKELREASRRRDEAVDRRRRSGGSGAHRGSDGAGGGRARGFSFRLMGRGSAAAHDAAGAELPPEVAQRLEEAQMAELHAQNQVRQTVLRSLEEFEQLEVQRIEGCSNAMQLVNRDFSALLLEEMEKSNDAWLGVRSISRRTDCAEMVSLLESGAPCPWLAPVRQKQPAQPHQQQPHQQQSQQQQQGGSGGGALAALPSTSPVKRAGRALTRAERVVPAESPAAEWVRLSQKPGLSRRLTFEAMRVAGPIKRSSRVLLALAGGAGAAERPGEYAPWLPGAGGDGWKLSDRQWLLASYEQLLLCCNLSNKRLPVRPAYVTSKRSRGHVYDFSLVPASAAAPGDAAGFMSPPKVPSLSVLEDVMRAQVGLTRDEYADMVDALRSPLVGEDADAAGRAAQMPSLVLSVTYRVMMLRATGPGAFLRTEEFLEWHERQLGVVLSSLLWCLLNAADTVAEWRAAGRVMTTDEAASHAHGLVSSLHRVRVSQPPREEWVGLDRPTLRQRHEDDNRRAADTAAELEQFVAAVARQAAQVTGDDEPRALLLPFEVTHNMYGTLLWTCARRTGGGAHDGGRGAAGADDDLDSLDGSDDDDGGGATAGARLHASWRRIVSEIDVLRHRYHVSDHFHSLCLVRTLLGVVLDQEAQGHYHALSVDAVLVEGVLDELDEALRALEGAEFLERDTHYRDQVLHHAERTLELWLSDLYMGGGDAARRAFELFGRVDDLQFAGRVDGSVEEEADDAAGRKARRTGGSRTAAVAGAAGANADAGERTLKVVEYERAYVREKRVGRMISRSVAAYHDRLRAGLPPAADLRRRDWEELVSSVALAARRTATEYAPALTVWHRTGVQAALLALASRFRREADAYFRRHPALSKHTIRVIPLVAAAGRAFEEHAAGLWPAAAGAPAAGGHPLRAALPSVSRVAGEQLRAWIDKQAEQVRVWMIRAVVMDSEWRAMGPQTLHSSSAVDVFSILFSAVDVFWQYLSSLRPHGLDSVGRFLLMLNGVLEGYGDALVRSCGEAEDLDLRRGGRRRHNKSVTLSAEDASSTLALVSTLPTLCVRLCNLRFCVEKTARLAATWRAAARKHRTEAAPPEQPHDALPGPAEDATVLDSARDALERHAATITSLAATCAVFSEWLPALRDLFRAAAPPERRRAAGGPLGEAVDATMASLYRWVADDAFAGVCEQVLERLADGYLWAAHKNCASSLPLRGAAAAEAEDDIEYLFTNLFHEEVSPAVLEGVVARVRGGLFGPSS